MKSPTQILSEEHQVILRMLGCLEVVAQQSGETGQLDIPQARQMLDFFREFADAWHHGKEEKLLFPAMAAAGVPEQGGPVGAMKAEHEMGREGIAAIGQALDGMEQGVENAAQAFRRNAFLYVDLLRGHIQKEDQILFPMADGVVASQELTELVARFSQEETDQGLERGEIYRALAATLGEQYGVAEGGPTTGQSCGFSPGGG